MHRKNGPDNAFYFKQFHIQHDRCAMKVGTDGVLLGAWSGADTAQHILDIGTGTGLIALMLAQRSQHNAHIDAIEIDFDAHQQAVENVNNSVWHQQINVYHTPLQQFQPSLKYDLIVSNPPYFVKSLKPPDLQRNLSRHTYELPYAAIIDSCTRLLHPKGRLCLILPLSEGIIFIQQAEKVNLFCSKRINVRHKLSTPIKRLLLEFSCLTFPYQEEELILFDEEGKRSKMYHQLVSSFYLQD